MSRCNLPEATSVAACSIWGHLWAHSEDCVPEWHELRAKRSEGTECKANCAWKKWKMPSACYSPTRNIKNPFLGASWKVWMSSTRSQVPLCWKLSLPGCLHNGSAINHQFWRLSVLLQAPCPSHQGNKTTGFNKCGTFLPWGCCSKISYHPVATQDGNYSTRSPVAQMQTLNKFIVIYG